MTTHNDAEILPNFEYQFNKNLQTLYKTNATASYNKSFLFTKATFVTIEFESS